MLTDLVEGFLREEAVLTDLVERGVLVRGGCVDWPCGERGSCERRLC